MSRRRGLVRIGGGLIAVPMLAVWLASAGLAQQPRRLLEPGDAVVTGFSGVLPPVQIAPGINPAEKTFIDLAGPSLRLFDLQDLHGPASAQLVQTLKTYTATAAQVGQVFGVALDNDDPPNIYVAPVLPMGFRSLPRVPTASLPTFREASRELASCRACGVR